MYLLVSLLVILMSQSKKIYSIQYNNNGKANPDDVVLYLYTTYDTNSFDPISTTSYPMVLEQTRGFHDG